MNTSLIVSVAASLASAASLEQGQQYGSYSPQTTQYGTSSQGAPHTHQTTLQSRPSLPQHEQQTSTHYDPYSAFSGYAPSQGSSAPSHYPTALAGYAASSPSPYGSAHGASPQVASAYGASAYGASPQIASAYGASPYGASPYGASPYGASPYGASPYGASAYGAYGASPYGSGAGPYQAQYAASPYANTASYASPYSGAHKHVHEHTNEFKADPLQKKTLLAECDEFVIVPQGSGHAGKVTENMVPGPIPKGALAADSGAADSGDALVDATIKIGQVAGFPAQAEGTISRNTLGEYQYVIKETGGLGAECAVADAADEYNPSANLDAFGNPATTSDSGKGRLDKFTTTMMTDDVWDQDKLYQNLAGNDSLMGRAVVIYATNDDTDETNWTLLGCCTLARGVDTQPAAGNVPIPHSHTTSYYGGHQHVGGTSTFSQFAQAAGYGNYY